MTAPAFDPRPAFLRGGGAAATDPIAGFRSAMIAAGLEPPDSIIPDGRLHRFSTNGKRGDDAGWYVLHLDGVPAGAFGCWRLGIDEQWCARSDRDFAPAERAEFRRRMDEAREARRRAEEKARAGCRQRAEGRLRQAAEAKPDHPYLVAKGVKPHGVRQKHDRLVIPVRDVAGTLHGLQFIGPDGRKLFLTDTAKAGHFYLIGEPGDRLVIAEGFATAASVHEASGLPVAVAFDKDNLRPVAEALHWRFPNARFVIAADNDASGVGQTKAKAAAEAVGGAAVIPPKPGDWNDVAAAAGLQAVRTAFNGTSEGDGPLPLFPPLPASEPFPVPALGPVLADAAGAIARKVQVPEAIAAQSVLAVAALAAQAHADVLLPYEQTRPLSLFFVTVAASGDRKSSADNEALWPIRKCEKALKEEHDRERREWLVASAAWAAEKRKIEGQKALDYEGRKAALAALGPEPERPLHPFLTAPEPTVEGLVKEWRWGPASLGIFSAEGGQFVGGHGMSQDHRLKSAAAYSSIWDGAPIKRVRASDGVSILNGRRLSLHLMVQAEVAAQFLADPLLRDQGLLSRVLVAAPESIAGSRFYRETAPADDAAIKAYGARILALLEAPWPLAEGQANELEPPALKMSADAAAAWRQFHDHVEGQCGPNGGLAPVRDFAAKAAEHAARIAGVLAIVADRKAAEIGMAAMAPALRLADWYLTEAVRLQGAAHTDPRLMRAKALLDWLHQQGEEIGFRDVLRFGPNAIRQKAVADEALRILADHGWVSEVCTRPRRFRINREGEQ